MYGFLRMRASKTLLLKHRFILFLLLLLFLSSLVITAIGNLERSTGKLQAVERQRYETSKLAHQLKEVINAMSRNVMAYVSSEQPEFRDNYNHLTDVLKGKAEDTDGSRLPILARFQAVGISQEETQTLEKAMTQLEELAQTQTEAMNTASGQFDDGQGGVRIALPNALLAKVMVFSQQYTDAAAQITQTINDFDTLQSDRMEARARQATNQNRQAGTLALAASIILILASALALWTLYRSIKKPLHDSQVLAENLASGQLHARVSIRRNDELGRMQNALNNIGQSLSLAVTTVREQANTIAASSHTITSDNEDLSQRTDEQASRVQETLSTMSQLAQTVSHNAQSAAQSATFIEAATGAAHQASETANQAVTALQAIDERSGEIRDITHLIRTIAFQTNILALNATIEAARAGVHGRSFAVVAAEVRNLAQRTATAAQSIEAMLNESLEHIHTGVAHVERAGHATQNIVQQMISATTMIADIVAASSEQSTRTHSMLQAIGQLDAITQKNQALVHRAAGITRRQEDGIAQLRRALSHLVVNSSESEENVTIKMRPSYEKPYGERFDMAQAGG
jgi:methyl-accepting chemotaxis protein